MKFVTLGPQGSCHENALNNYLAYHSVEDFKVILLDDLLVGLEMLRAGSADYLVQCSAHLNVHIITEKYYPQVCVTDTFMFPTKELVLLEDAKSQYPQVLGLVKATEGYLGDVSYPQVVYEYSKPVVGAKMLAGKYDAGLTHLEYYTEHPGRFRIRKYIGRVLTTWLVFGTRTIYTGSILGLAPRGFYRREHGEGGPGDSLEENITTRAPVT